MIDVLRSGLGMWGRITGRREIATAAGAFAMVHPDLAIRSFGFWERADFQDGVRAVLSPLPAYRVANLQPPALAAAARGRVCASADGGRRLAGRARPGRSVRGARIARGAAVLPLFGDTGFLLEQEGELLGSRPGASRRSTSTSSSCRASASPWRRPTASETGSPA
ncbi:MAG: hypothetical protein JO023_00425 [Chloroflexi bacterium]|nr:hypothetical protein [Chloroflexota bacterium]